MKLSLRTLALVALPLLSIACGSTEPAPGVGVDEDAESSEAALTSTARSFVGSYARPRSSPLFPIDTLSLVDSKSSYGRYVVGVGRSMPQEGAWRVYKYRGELRLKLRPDGAAEQTYRVERLASGALELVAADGAIGTLEPAMACDGVRCPQQTLCKGDGPVRCEVDPCAEVRCAANARCVVDEVQAGAGVARCVPWMPSVPAGACRKTGCSGELCADHDAAGRCLWRAEFACYQTAICELGADGQCGFRQTPELAACVASPP